MNKLDALFDFNATALRVRAQRQEILAANIANADTPNFKARDIDFASSLKKALEANVSNTANTAAGGLNGALPLATSHQNHIPGNGTKGGISEADLLYRPLIQSSVDGNSVDGEVERTAFVDNAIHYEANITMLNASIKDMNEALKPSV
ncbi:flagellar basal body rod protein FlgB [Polynucleobacter sp. AP-Feld-500C-C5]|jgi:flagellar basal-body rod protein FlgB|uniref:flagellar basal body rod protein FlgB n=1 Tax=Polynucleobacter sp. AP-Feld-500C-C5 TaxID=2576924 RepID=UPI001C0D49DA|nr:flagellar basal body rod protein FlgB [Polynucleobacter sp. AP-Feld-500C-C5]MBU3633131.1 flagellar basal body rod protein FlgB [Polynucleobacter sp. AP-Feld-500C-C5]